LTYSHTRSHGDLYEIYENDAVLECNLKWPIFYSVSKAGCNAITLRKLAFQYENDNMYDNQKGKHHLILIDYPNKKGHLTFEKFLDMIKQKIATTIYIKEFIHSPHYS